MPRLAKLFPKQKKSLPDESDPKSILLIYFCELEFTNWCECRSLERSSTNKSTVNIRLSKKILCIFCLHLSTVLNDCLVCHICIVELCNVVTAVLVNCLCISWSGCLSCTDCPNWFVCDCYASHVFC